MVGIYKGRMMLSQWLQTKFTTCIQYVIKKKKWAAWPRDGQNPTPPDTFHTTSQGSLLTIQYLLHQKANVDILLIRH